MARTRYRDSAGYGRPVPLLLTTRIRLLPAWLTRRHPRIALAAAAVAGVAAIVVLVLAELGQLPGQRTPDCGHASGIYACR